MNEVLLRRSVCALLVAGAMASVAPAAAQAPVADAKSTARDAYKRGEAALAKEDFIVAATEFLRAFETLPNDVALASASDAIVHTDDLALAARALEDGAARRSDDAIAALRAIEQRFGTRLGHLVVECRASSCDATELGKALVVGVPHWVVPGVHTIATRVDGRPSLDRAIEVTAGGTARLVLAPPSPAAGPTPPPSSDGVHARVPERKGLSPIWVVVSGGLTLVAAGIATWSTLDVTKIHDDYTSKRCASEGSPACDDVAARGKSADTRTVILWGVTGALGAVTLATGLFFVRWSANDGAQVGLARAW